MPNVPGTPGGDFKKDQQGVIVEQGTENKKKFKGNAYFTAEELQALHDLEEDTEGLDGVGAIDIDSTIENIKLAVERLRTSIKEDLNTARLNKNLPENSLLIKYFDIMTLEPQSEDYTNFLNELETEFLAFLAISAPTDEDLNRVQKIISVFDFIPLNILINRAEISNNDYILYMIYSYAHTLSKVEAKDRLINTLKSNPNYQDWIRVDIESRNSNQENMTQ